MLLKANKLTNFYGLHCDKDFAFSDAQEKCIRTLVGNCLYKEIRENVINCIVNEDAPQHIKDLVDGVTYEAENISSCCCECQCNCKTKVWQGLRKLVELCIKSKYLRTKKSYLVNLQNKSTGSVKTIEQSFSCLKMDLHNDLTYLNNIGDCNCVSLHRFISDHKCDYEEFCGKILKTISII